MILGSERAGVVEEASAEMQGLVDVRGWRLLLWAAGQLVHLCLQELPLWHHLEEVHHDHHVGAYHDPCKDKKSALIPVLKAHSKKKSQLID